MNTKLKTILGAVLFLLLLVAAYFTYTNLSAKYRSGDESDSGSKENTENAIIETITSPEFTVLDTEGNEVKLSDFFGKPIVLNFWASWCPPCKSEMPHFDDVYQDVKEDVVFLMIDLVDGQRETIKKGSDFIAKSGYTFPVYFDTKQDAANAFGISSIPSTFFINKEGEIVKFKDNRGNVVTGYQGAIDKKTLLYGINLIK